MIKNKKSGFAIVKLLVGIIILGITTLIAIPIVKKIIKENNAESFKTATNDLVSAIEDACNLEHLKGESLITTYSFNNGEVEPSLNINGSLPKNGIATVDSKCNVSISVTNGDLIAEKGFVDNCITVTEGKEVGNTVYLDGTVIYYNPETNRKCSVTDYNENINASDVGTKTGCMKWYTFNDENLSDTTVNLILDHNTTVSVAFNSKNISTSMKEVTTSLVSDTSTWAKTLNARLIKATEIAQIVNYNSFASSQNEVYIDTLTSTAPISLSNYHYGWLYDRLSISCKESSNCLNNAESNATTATMWGYWTSTARFNTAWSMDYYGRLQGTDPTTVSGIGIRPVITVNRDDI